MFFPRCASWYAFWGRRPCCMKSCTVCTGAVSPRCYFTFSLSSSSFCKNFVGNADNEHNGTIKRKGSLFFGDERKSSKPEKLKKWGWCARDFCEDALSTGERDIGAKKRQVLLDPSKKLLLPKHNMHTFKILIHSMEKRWQISLSRLPPASRGPWQLLRRHCESTANFLFGLSWFASRE